MSDVESTLKCLPFPGYQETTIQNHLQDVVDPDRRKIRRIESNAECRYLNTCKGTMRQNNFVGSDIWSETECLTPAEYGLQHKSTPSTHSATHCLCILYFDFGGGGDGEVNQREG